MKLNPQFGQPRTQRAPSRQRPSGRERLPLPFSSVLASDGMGGTAAEMRADRLHIQISRSTGVNVAASKIKLDRSSVFTTGTSLPFGLPQTREQDA
jgi:hypothetical protein